MKGLLKKTDIERVEFFLREYPELRDDDEALVTAIHNQECLEMHGTYLNFLYADQYRNLIRAGLFTSPESITRNRRAVVRKNPELIGNGRRRRKQLQKEATIKARKNG